MKLEESESMSLVTYNYSFATNISKDLELLDRARNKSEFIKYLIANEPLVVSQLLVAYTRKPQSESLGDFKKEQEEIPLEDSQYQ